MDLTLLLMTPSLGAVIDVVKGFMYVLFILIALVMTVVILLQEGKGGGLGGAFGGAAADTFGVKAGTVNRFTAYLAAGFLGLALLYAGLTARGGKAASIDITPPSPEVMIDDLDGTTATDAPVEAPPADAPADASSDKPVEAPPADAPVEVPPEDVPPTDGDGG